MSWRDSLQPASFRGVAFKTFGTQARIGRRNVLHQYPFRDKPYLEDLGRDASEYKIDGYVIQNKGNQFNYFQERDTLMDALMARGAGTLVHPSLGEINVAVSGRVSVEENFAQEGGIAKFSMVFVEAGTNQNPTEEDNPLSLVGGVVGEVLDRVMDTFGEGFSVEDMPGFAVLSAIQSVQTQANMIVAAVTSIQGAVLATVNSAVTYVQTLRDSVIDIIDTPCDVARVLVDGYNSFMGIIGEFGETITGNVLGSCSGRLISSNPPAATGVVGRSAVLAALALTRFGEPLDTPSPSPYGGRLPAVPLTTEVRVKQAANQIAIVNAARTAAIATAAQIGIRGEYESYDDAMGVLENILDALDAHLLKLGDESADTFYRDYGISISQPSVYEGLQQIRPALIKGMGLIGADLARVESYLVPPTVENILTLSYQKYEDINRATEIFERNKPLVVHPGFLPSGETIELLGE